METHVQIHLVPLHFFVVTGGLVGGAYLLSQYAISKFQQIQEKLVNDKNAKEK